MRSIKLTSEDSLYDQDILDFKNQLMIKIYQTGKVFSFRFSQSKDHVGENKDPINNSDYDWAYGPFNSPKEAKVAAITMYTTFGLDHLLSIKKA